MDTTVITAEVENQPRLRGAAFLLVIIGLMLTLFLEALDQAIVGTAMPRIIAQLHGLDRYSWVVTAYILASVTMVPAVGKLSDQFGRKGFLLAGTVLFLLGSILAGGSQSMDQLIIFRSVQGLGAGIGIALIATVMGDLVPPAERAKLMGIFGMVYGVSSLLGPAIGGWLAEHGPLLGQLVTEGSRWRWVFYINLPIGLIAVALVLVFLPAHSSVRTSTWLGWSSLRAIDFPGALLCAAATICLILGLTWGGNQTLAWTSPQVLSMLAAGVVLFALFVVVESKVQEPILPLDLFRNQIFSVGAVLSLLQMMVLLGLSLYLPLFLQGVLAVSPTNAGLVMTPFSLSMVLGAMVSSGAISKLKRYQMVAILGALVMSVGAFFITLMTPGTSLLQAILFTVLVGLGCGTFFSLPMLVVQNALPQSRLGVSTAALRYLGQVGASLGIAIVGTAVTSSASGNLMSHLPTNAGAKLVLSGALTHGFLAVLIFTLLALVATFFLKDLPLKAEQADTKLEEVGEADEMSEKITRGLVHA